MTPGMIGSLIGSIGGMVGLFLGLLGACVGIMVGGVEFPDRSKKCNDTSARPCIERNAVQGTAHNSTVQSTTDSGTIQKTAHDSTEKDSANGTVLGAADNNIASSQKTP